MSSQVTLVTYKRDEGVSPLEKQIFGVRGGAICNHPLAARVKDDGVHGDPNSLYLNTVGTCL
eukprot:5093243-Ditylum_brightwellii.AAC.1